MRKFLALTVAAIAAAALVGGTAFAAKDPPVSLEGKVSNKGEKTVKKGKISIAAGDFFFKPTFDKAKLGSTVKVSLKNSGKTQHTFTVDSLGIDEVLDAGKKATVDVTLPSDGALAFYCRFHGPNASDQGMQGAFFSKKGEAVSTGGGAAPSNGAPTATTSSRPSASTPSGPYGY
jgi:uncharacterized cupredoxin-like copper-binding protein